MNFKPTDEQSMIIKAFLARENMVVRAGAGAAKTTTCVMMANAALTRKGRFMAFNRAIVDAAALKMPANVKCSTFHGYFYGIVGRNYRHRSASVSARQSADILGIDSDLMTSDTDAHAPKLSAIQQVRSVYAAINKFSMSDDKEINGWHIPWIRGFTPEQMSVVRNELASFLTIAWRDISDVNGKLRFKPENYVKIGAMMSPRIAASFVMIDEAQDTFPVILGWLKRQYHTQMIVVGDPAQAINGWTGAIDSMDKFGAKFTEYTLSQSFRFGPAIATEANKLLSMLGDFRIKGFDAEESIVCNGEIEIPEYAEDETPDTHAILCRTNAGVIEAAIRESQNTGRKIAMPDAQVTEIRNIAKAAMQLMNGQACDYPDFAIFKDWSEVQEYVKNDPSGADIKTTVTIVDKYGAEALITLADSLVPVAMCDTLISTVHKTKGLEWDIVEIAFDFPEPKPTSDGERGEITKDELMLYYVAFTRAKYLLSRGGLAWIDDYVTDQADDTDE
jgi:hypothetical protein